DLREYARLAESPRAIIDEAVRDARAAYAANRRTPTAERVRWLIGAANALEEDSEAFLDLLISDIGKPRKAATFEVQRSIAFIRACAAQLLSFGGESIPVDSTPAGAGRLGFTRRVPYGVVAGIAPFNAPLNLLAQKV